jgi:hypothetical protein
MNRRMHRNAWALAAALAVVTVAAGCSNTPDDPKREPSTAPPITAEPGQVAESAAKYNALTADLVAALEAKMPDITWTVDDPARMSRLNDGRCMLAPRSMKSNADIVAPSRQFEDVFAVADPVLKEHGFPSFDGIDPVPGGWVVTRSTDAAGATVTIESKSPAHLQISVPVKSENCDANEIPQGDR